MDDPKKIGKYELREFLGGGMSHVYKTWDTVMNRTVAVKILTPEATADPEAKARFLREAQTAGGLAHDNVIRVYDFGEAESRPYMVMEFLEGEDLREAIRSGRAGDLGRRLEIALDVARALEYIHRQSIIHRDIKPENIHLDTNGRVRLMDFGIAKRPDLSLTRAGFTLGTPYYMSPEQVRGEEVTHLADVYSFGILLFELLTGNKPISGETVEQLFYQVLNEPVDLEPLRQTGVPESLVHLISRCTEKAPGDRPQGFREVRKQIERALGGALTEETPTTSKRARPAVSTKKWLIPLAAVAVLVLATVLYVAFREGPVSVQEPIPTTVPLASVLSTPTGDMMLIPEGEFQFGAQHQPASLPAFYIDKTEATNEAYARFCAERNHPLPPGYRSDQPDYPVANITIADAREFAQWAGKRLPTAEEWEKAARGADGRSYPWGNEADPSRANVADNPSRRTDTILPAASSGSGASPYGVLRMAGNVWELIDEFVTPSPGAVKAFAGLPSPAPTADDPWCTIRGGAFDVPLAENAAYEWAAIPARFKATNIGFRCVKEIR